MDDQKGIIKIEFVTPTEEEMHTRKELEQSIKYIKKLIDRRTVMEWDVDRGCELGSVLCVMTGEQLAEVEDFCSEKLDYHDWIFEADEKMDDKKYEILKKYVFEHLTIGQVIDLAYEINT